MATQNGGYLRYNGPAESRLVENVGHFFRGESRFVDYLTYCAFSDENCKAEGWEVSTEPFPSSDEKAAVEETPRSRKRVDNEKE